MTRFVRQPAADLTVDPSTPIWRYRNLDKLLWTLAKGCLWFARADTLGDRYEGTRTRAFRDTFLKQLTDLLPTEADTEEFLGKVGSINRAFVQNTSVNCWHMSEHESAAMWSLYVGLGQGVAIRSTIDRLLRAIPVGDADATGRDENGLAKAVTVEFGTVTYIDYHTDEDRSVFYPWKMSAPFFQKRKEL
jgi:hypothetical protein